MNYRELNYLSLATQIMATLWAFSLPAVKNSLYFHRQSDNQSLVVDAGDNRHGEYNSKSSSIGMAQTKDEQKKVISPFQLLWLHFKSAYTNKQVIKWSIWYALAMCAYFQITAYIQVLWAAIDSTQEVSGSTSKLFF
jgi:solute carrier family 19 (thiamine transporter), member 2/3